MIQFNQSNILENLNVKGDLFFRNDIIQDDILYSKIDLQYQNSNELYIIISLLKKNNNKTKFSKKFNFSSDETIANNLMPARRLVHWWHITTQYGAPSIIPGIISLGIITGTMLEPTSAATNAAIVRTTLSDQNYQIILKVEKQLSMISGYTMILVQGSVYSSEKW